MSDIKSPATHVETFQEGRQLKVVTPAVEMNCELPLGCAVQGQGCHVRFLRLPVSCTLTPEDILHDALIGINTMLSKQTRRYLHQYHERGWQMRLGRTLLELYGDEAAEVCACLDVIGQRYAQALREATTRLETWDYLQADTCNREGVLLLSLHWDLWQLVRRFASEVQCVPDQHDRYYFVCLSDEGTITIEEPVSPILAVLRPIPHEAQLSDKQVALMFEYPDDERLVYEHGAEQSWQVGNQMDVWTATYTENWLVDTFIPHVCSYYQTGPMTRWLQATGPVKQGGPVPAMAGERALSSLVRLRQSDQERVPWQKIQRPGQLIPYVQDIQRWLAAYPVPLLPAVMLRPYYAAIEAFVKATRISSSLNRGKPTGNVPWEECSLHLIAQGQGDAFSMVEFSTSTRRQVDIINRSAYEHRRCADLLSQLWLQFVTLECGVDDEKLLVMMRDAVRPLWEQARFDMRYVIVDG